MSYTKFHVKESRVSHGCAGTRMLWDAIALTRSTPGILIPFGTEEHSCLPATSPTQTADHVIVGVPTLLFEVHRDLASLPYNGPGSLALV